MYRLWTWIFMEPAWLIKEMRGKNYATCKHRCTKFGLLYFWDVTKTWNGEWGMGNGEWGMGNDWTGASGQWCLQQISCNALIQKNKKNMAI